MVSLSDGEDGVKTAAGSQRVELVAAQRASIAIMLLKRPSLSAMTPAPARPMQEPVLRMAMSW